MKEYIRKIQELNPSNDFISEKKANANDIDTFEKKNKLIIPRDLKDYFILINGSNNKYDLHLFNLYSFSDFKTVKEGLSDWSGVPDYSKITNKLQNHNEFYLIADYSFHLCVYAIRLYPYANEKNEVIAIIGDKYKQVCTSFTNFIDLFG